MRNVRYWYELSHEEQVERWENVARVLRELTPHERKKHFNMSCWGEKTECGTIACAAGFCGLDPWFRRRGFKMTFEKATKSELVERPEVKWYGDLNMCVGDFFGNEGSGQIFLNTYPRSYGTVQREIKEHIRLLKLEEKDRLSMIKQAAGFKL